MKDNNDTPQPRGAPENQANHTRIHLSPTQSRIVTLLLNKPHISFDLERFACCRYAADQVQHLRNKGIDIVTTMIPYIRQVDKKNRSCG